MFHEHRFTPGLYDPNLPVNVIFDLGFTDATVAIFWQEHRDGLRVIHVEATQGKDIFHHIEHIHQFSATAELGSVWLPPDARAKNLQTGRSMVEQFLENDIRPNIVPNHKVRDRLAATRRMFPRISVESNDEGCEDLIEALKGYRRKWDEKNLMFEDQPLHDWCSDYADSFGYMCVVAASHYGISSSDMTTKPNIIVQVPSEYNLSNLFADHEAKMARIQRIA
jgi:phage terminase large subunit